MYTAHSVVSYLYSQPEHPTGSRYFTSSEKTTTLHNKQAGTPKTQTIPGTTSLNLHDLR
jgi:hypothetical protein